MFDGKELRRVMGQFATGVTIITTRDADGSHYGLTANAVTSISLDPPLVLISIDRKTETFPHFFTSKVFVINVLSDAQEELSTRFAKSGGDKFAGVAYRVNDAGVAVLDGVVAHVECRIVQTHEAGDHVIHLGEVDAAALYDPRPLLFFQGRYGRLA
jgi:3-hydroxy-9,10-secoandrosta-1,3,5(10)-triene-9,17-dione monooxygenase reductase component